MNERARLDHDGAMHRRDFIALGLGLTAAALLPRVAFGGAAPQPWIVPIPGTTKLAHAEENVRAADVRLTPADMQEMETGYAALTIQGARAADDVMALIDAGARAGTSSRGGRGNSPLPVHKDRGS